MLLQIVMMTALATGASKATAPECAWNHVPSRGALVVTAALAALHGRCHGGVQDKGAIRVLSIHTFLYWATVQFELNGKCRHDGTLVAVLPAAILNWSVYFTIARVCRAPKLTEQPRDERQAHNDLVLGGSLVAVMACIVIGVAAL